MLGRSAVTGVSSTNRRPSANSSDGLNRHAVGVSLRWSGSNRHHRKSNSIQLGFPWMPYQQQRFHFPGSCRNIFISICNRLATLTNKTAECRGRQPLCLQLLGVLTIIKLTSRSLAKIEITIKNKLCFADRSL